ncbi:MAG: hypothetical protein OXH00_11700 [Candidatus Poribacteria bacterium]|nr:hypothetical protein [Candidatus Poribacteria bacterium]
MLIYTWRGEEYLVTQDWLVGDLHMPMNTVTEAIVRAANNSWDAHQIEAYIREAVAGLGLTHAEAAVVPPAEEISLENAESGEPLELVINGETYHFKTDQYETLKDFAVWIAETLNQAVERVTAAYVTQLETHLENAGFSKGDITLKIEKR